jgi:hypothetical protein
VPLFSNRMNLRDCLFAKVFSLTLENLVIFVVDIYVVYVLITVHDDKAECVPNEFNKLQPSIHVRFEVFTMVTMMNAVLWAVTPSDSYRNRRFAGTQRLHHQSNKNL